MTKYEMLLEKYVSDKTGFTLAHKGNEEPIATFWSILFDVSKEDRAFYIKRMRKYIDLVEEADKE